MTHLLAEDLRGAFVGDTVTLASPLGALTIGVMDAAQPGVAEAVSRLLVRSIQDAREGRGGHLPEWLVDDIERNYISPQRVRTLWAATGYRFGLLLGGELVGTVHVARDPDTILTIDRTRINVPAREFPGFKPDGYHHVVNLSVKHALRRARLGTALFDGIVAHFRGLFAGDGLWVRADPPWHSGLAGLGFAHDPTRDIFLPPDVARTAGLPHAALNARYACECPPPPGAPDAAAAMAARAEAMQTHKLQYVSFTRPFARPTRAAIELRAATTAPGDTIARDDATRERFARDWSGVDRSCPDGVAFPASVDEVAALLARAAARGTPVVARGRGFSAGGQSLAPTGGVVLATERLAQIGPVERDRVTVEAGVTWRALVRALAPRRVLPPVITGWTGATVGGTLATGGLSKGSHRAGMQIDHVESLVVVTGDGRRVECSRDQAAWLFHAALGGLGRFGVIARATIRLEPARAFAHVMRREVGADPAALLAALDAACDEPDTYHVTSYASPPDARWTVVQTIARDTDTRSDPATTVLPLLEYVDPPRDERLPGVVRWVHDLVPRAYLPAYLAQCAAVLQLDAGDALQVIPVRQLHAHRGSLAPRLDVPDGTLAYAVCITREAGARDELELATDTTLLARTAQVFGGARYLVGALPPDADAWRDHLGDEYDAMCRMQRLADPAGVLRAGIDLAGPSRRAP